MARLFTVTCRYIANADAIKTMRESQEYKDYLSSTLTSVTVLMKGYVDPGFDTLTFVSSKSRETVWESIMNSPMYKKNYAEYDVLKVKYYGDGNDFFNDFRENVNEDNKKDEI
jgi:hypothetical protein